jgi:HAD superfamily hydrolase (TIGR01484 family)
MSEPAVAPPSALLRWDEIRPLFAGRRAAVFLDFDGTLSPIVERPGDAAILPAAKRAVERLAAKAAAVVVVSGRGREDVARRVGLPHLIYAGSHGFDIAAPVAEAVGEASEAGNLAVRREDRAGPGDLADGVPGRDLPPLIERVAASLRRDLATVPGAEVEAKRYTVAVHYRRVPGAVAGQPRLTVAEGKKVFEVRPSLDWDKGRALLHLLAVLGLDGGGAAGTGSAPHSVQETVAVYVGDDVTDEDAFRALAGRPGPSLTVRVADQPAATAAAYSLAGPQEVAELLERLADAL